MTRGLAVPEGKSIEEEIVGDPSKIYLSRTKVNIPLIVLLTPMSNVSDSTLAHTLNLEEGELVIPLTSYPEKNEQNLNLEILIQFKKLPK